MFVFSCTELDKYLITSSYQVSLPLVNCFAVSSTRITQWPTWLTLLWHGPLRSQPMKWWLICFSLGWLSFKSLSKRHRHTRTHLPPSTTKSKQGLSGCSELCLMQQDERCCHVVKSRSMWWRQVFLSNNKSRTQEKLERIKEGMKKERTNERKKGNKTIWLSRGGNRKETWCIASGHAAWTESAAVSPTRDASVPESWSQPRRTLEQRNKDCFYHSKSLYFD